MSTKYLRIGLAILCGLCFFEMPYAYYEIFRLIAMCSFIYLMIKDDDLWKTVWTLSAIVVQPFYKMPFNRDDWLIIDGIWIVLLVVSYINIEMKVPDEKVFSWGCVIWVLFIIYSLVSATLNNFNII